MYQFQKKMKHLIPTFMDQSPTFLSLESKVFTEHKGKIYIGKEEIKPELLAILKEQAKYLESSQIYEILNATIINEANNMALIQSTEWEHILSAKMLHHWNYVLRNMVY